jgi:hypothetical protein
MNRRRASVPAAAMLTRFTRASKTASALDNLVAILADGVVHGSHRMIRGNRAAVCMFDVPIAELSGILDRQSRRRYEPFGIAVDKRYAFAMGARPVIYLPWREAEKILAPEESWRVVSMEMGASSASGASPAICISIRGAPPPWSRRGRTSTKSSSVSTDAHRAPA